MSESKKPGASATGSGPGLTRGRERAANDEWLHRARAERPDPASRRGRAPRTDSTPVVVCDLGGLDDVHEMLGRLGARPLRVSPEELEELHDWERPTQLFITTVRIALSHELVMGPLMQGATSVAVAESDAQTQSAAMLRRGFRYIVRRPVHPEALRLLLLQVLFRGRDHRGVARFPFGGEIRWRSGFKTGRCTMTEISAHGCRLLTKAPFPIGGRIRLSVPPALSTSGPLRLRGEVVRRDRGDPDAGRPFVEVAVQFEGLSARTRAHLDALLAERASGPATVVPEDPSGLSDPGTPRSTRRGPSRFLSLTKEPEGERALDETLAASEIDRRRRPRRVWQTEIVALDDTERALHTLMGSDLSTGGLRVEPHPMLRLGDRLNLALFDATHAEPLIVVACVARDDGARGWGLVFESLDNEGRARLQTMTAELPPVSAYDADSGEAASVVLGEIKLVKSLAKRGR